MTIYIGWWPVIGLLIPFLPAAAFFAYFHLWHFPRVMMRRPKGMARELDQKWEMWMLFYDSGGYATVSPSRYQIVNDVLSMLNLGFKFAVGETLPIMAVFAVIGLVAENVYRLFI